MRRSYLILAIGLLAACDMPDFGTSGPVDTATLPPLSSTERALIIAGDGAAQTGAYAQAERNYLDAVARSQGHVEAHLALGRYYITSRQYKKAADILEKAAEFQPKQPEVNYLLGKAYLQQGKAEEALVVFNRGIEATPTDAKLLSGAAIAYDSKGMHKTAQELHRKSINNAAAEDKVSFTSNLAMSLLLDDQPKQAVALLEPELKKPVMSQVLRHNLALAYGVLGRDAEARKLVKGELSEEARKANVAQLKEYIAKQRAEPEVAKPAQPKIHTVN